ncbi:MAG: hypothetical protein HYU63_05140, partial [Armatimonadetes bacterium]|nr:hypothetical protein [Armatimonadota bacterium]
MNDKLKDEIKNKTKSKRTTKKVAPKTRLEVKTKQDFDLLISAYIRDLKELISSSPLLNFLNERLENAKINDPLKLLGYFRICARTLKEDLLKKEEELNILKAKKENFPKKSEVEIRDQKFDENYLKGLNQFDVIFRSPGIPYTCPEIQLAKKSGAKISSATELFFELNSPTPGVAATPGVSSPLIIGITGTKGKSTTSTLIYEILKKSGKDVYLAGNIGKPALDLIPRLSALSQRNSASTFIVLELSSFQLQALKHSPNVAVVLGLFPDHMDAHKSFKEYVEAKS